MLFNPIPKACFVTAALLLALLGSPVLSRAQSPTPTPTPDTGKGPAPGLTKRPTKTSKGAGRYDNPATDRLVYIGAGDRQGESGEALANFDRGMAQYKEGKLAEAIESLRQVTRLSPGWAEAQYALGALLSENNQLKEAVEPLTLSMQLKPKTDANDLYIGAAYNLGLAYFGLGRYEQAVEAYRQANSRDPGFSKVRYNLGLAFIQLGKLREAVEEFKAAVKLKPEYASARYNLGLAYLDLKETRLALEQQKELNKMDPELAGLLYEFIKGATGEN